MQVVSPDRVLSQSGVEDETEYGIDQVDAAFVMGLLRDEIYNDPKLAPLREYGSNGWDEHREAGIPERPIRVTLPTSLNPTLTIRDYGRGLSHKGIFRVYTRYGKSTKRNSNTGVGCLGIGSKSAFAYTDSWSIVSCHGGMRRTYAALLEDGDKGVCKLLDETPMDPGEETGIEIQIPVFEEDIWEFHEKAVWLFQHYRPLPDINIDIPQPSADEIALKHGYITPNHGTWVAVMGCVPYKIDFDQLGEDMPVRDALYNLSGVLQFDIGGIEHAANREGLRYSDHTKAALVQKFEDLVDEYVEYLLRSLRTKTLDWGSRLRAQILRQFKLPIPKKDKSLVATKVKVPEENSFRIIRQHYRQAVEYLPVETNTRLVIMDSGLDIKGYTFQPGDYLVEPREAYTVEEVEVFLTMAVRDLSLEGIPIVRQTGLPWSAPYIPPKPPPRKVDKKHRVSTFKLTEQSYFAHPYSRCWNIEKREPQDDDVYIIMSRFEALNDFDFYALYQKDSKLAKMFGFTMPPIYGYKTTGRKTRTDDNTKGTPYAEWRKTLAQQIMTPEIQAEMRLRDWANVIPNVEHAIKYGSHDYKTRTVRRKVFGMGANGDVRVIYNQFLAGHLGNNHPLVIFFRKVYESQSKWDDVVPARRQALENLSKLVQEKPAPHKFLTRMLVKYPLLGVDLHDEEFGTEGYRNFDALWSGAFRFWLDYIKMVDQGSDTSTQA